MQKRITSKELARLAGVSSATISRAFSPTALINKATRDRIQAIAREYDYQPNAIARSLNMQKSGLVALVVNTLGNPCEAEGMNLMVQGLQARGLMPIMLCCAEHKDRTQLMRLASAYQLDHVFIFSDMVSADDALEIFRNSRPIIVTSEPVDRPGTTRVRLDGDDAAEQIIARLVADGRRNFAYLAGRGSSWIDKHRQNWFAEALARRELQFVALGQGDYGYDSGFKEAVILLRRNKLDAIICGNDVMAIGACDAARHLLGRTIPDDLAIVGQDGVSIASWESHDLTTMALDHRAFIEAMVNLIDRESDAAEEMRVSYWVRWGTTT